jgi:hypothetical protein
MDKIWGMFFKALGEHELLHAARRAMGSVQYLLSS